MVVAVDLAMADRRTEARAADVAHGQQRDLVVEFDETLDDHPRVLAPAAAPARLRIRPGRVDIGVTAYRALALARRGHHGLDHAGQADGLDGVAILGLGFGETIGRCGQPQRLGRQPPDALAVHGQLRGARGGDHLKPFGFEFDEGRRGDGLDFGHDERGAFLFDDCAYRGAIGHVDDVMTMRHLHGRRARIAVDRDHLAAEPCQFDGDFLAEFAAAQQHDAGSGIRAWGAERGHVDP